MGMNPNTTVVVYIDGFGCHIHRLFAERYRIAPHSSVDRSVLDRHTREIPEEERARMSNWIHPDDIEYLRARSQILPRVDPK